MTGSLPWSRGVAAGLAGISLALAMPVRADSPMPVRADSPMPVRADSPMPVRAEGVAGDAADGGAASENLRRLDIMLMVTGLRCRTTADDFQADFQAFEARHLAELNAAARDMVAAYAAKMGADDANRMVDRLSVQMANRYGNGHPWLGCHELKGLTQALAAQDGRAVLLQAASETLDGEDAPPMSSAPPARADGVTIAAR